MVDEELQQDQEQPGVGNGILRHSAVEDSNLREDRVNQGCAECAKQVQDRDTLT